MLLARTHQLSWPLTAAADTNVHGLCRERLGKQGVALVATLCSLAHLLLLLLLLLLMLLMLLLVMLVMLMLQLPKLAGSGNGSRNARTTADTEIGIYAWRFEREWDDATREALLPLKRQPMKGVFGVVVFTLCSS